MSRLARCVSSLLVASSLFAAACSPAVSRGASDAGTPIARPDPRPAQPSIDRAKLRAALLQRRVDSYGRFIAYREARVYPVNNVNAGFEHVWLDDFGNLCAAATIIAADWGRDATVRVAADNNFLRLADVADGPLLDWMLTSGLTHHEIVAIQVPGFAGSQPDMPIQPGDPARDAEVARMYTLYVDVERQLMSMWEANLDDAVDALMKRPELARQLLDGVAAGPGRFGVETDPVAGGSFGFAQPPS